MVGWVGAEMEVVVDKNAGQCQEGLVTCQEMPCRTGIGRSTWEGPNTERHENAPA